MPGSRKGIPNKSTLARKAAIAASGLSPLDYLLSVMRDESAERSDRLEAAKAAAPYVHPKLAPIQPPKDDSLGPLPRPGDQTYLRKPDLSMLPGWKGTKS
jgi:hypothetical protein